jgi:small subunit ribosomal protein S24e
MSMEIEIQSKTDNVLLGRTEVHFVILHESEGNPKRELVRNELAEKLNAKKETIMIDFMRSSFGARKTVGYAKIYKSIEDAKAGEADPILKRNGLGTKKKQKKESKKEGEEKKETPKEKPQQQEPKVQPIEKSVETKKE